ncbi:glycosyltransferase family 2 protein [Salimicrobium flavidum]|uniref:Glycosyltransferase involved in cell wall bisynthesis n=1 Tax=Salimicrobium flavidum TaxID=570947 RepID=A0A1N7IZ98_9BACI|nr:glycosyltransferase family 2 protein [Salimicrobium flavidum]SIS42374.1 Glycosyltransferase involved in cell wall bisynthesis [Salimicrobium flavidum]
MEIAVLLPCYNEEQTIGDVIEEFRHELPDATIYVYDNNSKDATSEVAERHGAVVKKEFRQGKGNVVRSMFRDIEADYYIMADGDRTYPAQFAHQLLEPLINKEANIAIGDRLSNGTYVEENKRQFHNFGNNLVRNLINFLYKSDLKDIMTGYRAFDRLFVKSMPVMSPGFEIETEMTIHTLDKRFRIVEIPIEYKDRPEGSESKLNTISDGYKVVNKIFTLFKEYKPLMFFTIWAAVFLAAGLGVGTPVIIEFIQTGFISKVPSAILAVGLVIISMGAFVCGLILDTVASNFRRHFEWELNRIQSENHNR